MPYLQVLSEFREGVRKIAREQKGEVPPGPVGASSGVSTAPPVVTATSSLAPKCPRGAGQPGEGGASRELPGRVASPPLPNRRPGAGMVSRGPGLPG